MCDLDDDCISFAEEADVVITGGTSHFAVTGQRKMRNGRREFKHV